jgi:FKBP-type peptidyl-prolyl cis-trans isomerase
MKIILAVLMVAAAITTIVVMSKDRGETPDFNKKVASTTAKKEPATTATQSAQQTQPGQARQPQATSAQQTQSTNQSIQTEPMDLEIKTTQEGTGDRQVQNGDTLSMNYTGKLTDGTVFDSSIGRSPFSFKIGQGMVIQGWEKGILGMKVGEKRTLTIPAEMGYGAAGAGGGKIPPNATLIFDVELLSIQ